MMENQPVHPLGALSICPSGPQGDGEPLLQATAGYTPVLNQLVCQ